MPGGRSGKKRFRRTFQSKSEAQNYEAYIIRKYVEAEEWQQPKTDITRLSELAEQWYLLHGQSLKDGKSRHSILQHTIERLGDPLAANFSASDWSTYRMHRLKEVTPNTVNHEQAYLSAVFGRLIKLGHWKKNNPLIGVEKIRLDEFELAWLTTDQIKELLKELQGKDAQLIAEICLSTGARWSEAEGLEAKRVRSGKIHFVGTKSGRNRSVPINSVIHEKLTDRLRQGSFKSSYGDFSRGLAKTDIKLPKGQLTHVLRHTFASHFIMNGGHILTLQKILGHKDIKMTMRYAHLAEDHLKEAIQLNPLASLTDNP